VKVGSCRFSLWFECDAIAEAFEAAFEVGDGSGLADLVEIGFSEIAIGQVLSEHVIGGDEDFVSDGERGAQAAAAGLEAVELVLEVAALVREAEIAAPTRIVRRWMLPFRARPLFCLPALSWLPGQTPAQAARW
jgi:hypothetical protein